MAQDIHINFKLVPTSKDDCFEVVWNGRLIGKVQMNEAGVWSSSPGLSDPKTGLPIEKETASDLAFWLCATFHSKHPHLYEKPNIPKSLASDAASARIQGDVVVFVIERPQIRLLTFGIDDAWPEQVLELWERGMTDEIDARWQDPQGCEIVWTSVGDDASSRLECVAKQRLEGQLLNRWTHAGPDRIEGDLTDAFFTLTKAGIEPGARIIPKVGETVETEFNLIPTPIDALFEVAYGGLLIAEVRMSDEKWTSNPAVVGESFETAMELAGRIVQAFAERHETHIGVPEISGNLLALAWRAYKKGKVFVIVDSRPTPLLKTFKYRGSKWAQFIVETWHEGMSNQLQQRWENPVGGKIFWATKSEQATRVLDKVAQGAMTGQLLTRWEHVKPIRMARQTLH